MKRRAVALIAALTVLACTASTQAAPPKPLKVAIGYGPGKRDFELFARYFEKNYHVECRWLVAGKNGPFEDLAPLEDCDVILTNLYRTEPTPAQFAVLKKAFTGKPVVGMRRAHHGFQNWLEADREVFGVDYGGHYFGNNVTLRLVDKHKGNPVVKDVDTGRLPDGGLYSHVDPADDVEVYMVGGPEDKEPLPQCWSRVNAKTGQRVFYTRYGPKDLADDGVRDMVIRALFWAAGKDDAKYEKK